MRHTIAFIKKVKTDDALGGWTESDSTFLICKAAIWPLSANELIRNDQLQMDKSHRFRIDYREGITPNMEITWGSRTFEIKSIINIEERNRLLDILTLERENG
jgi:SPP1 family predicted phage head-tail adaptor